MASYRFRPAVAAASCLTTPVVVLAIWVIAGTSSEAMWLLVAIGVLVAGAIFLLNFRRVRARTLSADETGLVVQRDAYRLVVPWGAVTGVERRRYQRLFKVDELVVSDADVLPLDRKGRTTKVVPDEVREHPALTRVLVGAYDEDWRDGPIGEQLRARGVI